MNPLRTPQETLVNITARLLITLFALIPLAGRSTAPAAIPGSPAAPAHIEYTLEASASLTSAGIFDRAGKLVNILWTMKV